MGCCCLVMMSYYFSGYLIGLVKVVRAKGISFGCLLICYHYHYDYDYFSLCYCQPLKLRIDFGLVGMIDYGYLISCIMNVDLDYYDCEMRKLT